MNSWQLSLILQTSSSKSSSPSTINSENSKAVLTFLLMGGKGLPLYGVSGGYSPISSYRIKGTSLYDALPTGRFETLFKKCYLRILGYTVCEVPLSSPSAFRSELLCELPELLTFPVQLLGLGLLSRCYHLQERCYRNVITCKIIFRKMSLFKKSWY